MLKPNKVEQPFMIIFGITILYLVIAVFVAYLFFLHRVSLNIAISIMVVFTLIYIPRFWIIKEILKADKLKVVEDFFMINGVGVNFSDIKNFGVREYKPQVVFFLNNKMVVFQKADFCLETPHEKVEFTLIGSEKIKLMKEFLRRVIS